MGFLSDYDGTERLELGGGYWVEFKKCLSGAEREYVMERSYSFSPVGEGGRMTARLDFLAQTKEFAIASLVAWNLTGKDGFFADEVLPLDHDPDEERRSGEPSPRRRSYDALPGWAQDEIEGAVMPLNRKPSREEAVRFPAGSGSGDQDEADAAPDAVEVLDGGAVLEPAGDPG